MINKSNEMDNIWVDKTQGFETQVDKKYKKKKREIILKNLIRIFPKELEEFDKNCISYFCHIFYVFTL